VDDIAISRTLVGKGWITSETTAIERLDHTRIDWIVWELCPLDSTVQTKQVENYQN
jgi:hypothetical protein